MFVNSRVLVFFSIFCASTTLKCPRMPTFGALTSAVAQARPEGRAGVILKYTQVSHFDPRGITTPIAQKARATCESSEQEAFTRNPFNSPLPAAEQLKKLCEGLGMSGECFFSRQHDMRAKLISKIRAARRSIFVAVYTFSDLFVAQALVCAKKRGVDVVVIVDSYSMSKKWNRVELLLDADIPVFVKNSSRGLMHNKYAIFDNYSVWTGSFNWTERAGLDNDENAVYLSGFKDLTDSYTLSFTRLIESEGFGLQKPGRA